MPDAFFQKKRKRSTTGSTSSSSASRAGPSNSRSQPSSSSSSTYATNKSSRMRKSNKNAHSDNDDDGDDDDVPGGGIDDMDLSHNYNQGPNSDEEADAAETPAEARVRLAKMYLQGLSSSSSTGAGAAALGAGDDDGDDDFFENDDAPTFGLADAAQADRDNIAARLQKDVAQQSGKIHLFLSSRIASPQPQFRPQHEAEDQDEQPESAREAAAVVDYSRSLLAVRGHHRLSVTAAVASPDAKWLFTASKDGSIVRYRLRDGKMVRILPRRSKHLDEAGRPVTASSASASGRGKSKTSGAARRRARLSKPSSSSSRSNESTYVSVGEDQGHTDEIWTLSLSSDGQLLASGGKDQRICIWSVQVPSGEKFVKALGGHKDSISSLSFRMGSHELYTASLDRTMKLFDIHQLSYIETLFGHQESILSISCLGDETAVSAGGRDRTCRFWKIRDESQLVFRAGIKSKLRDVLEGGDLTAKLAAANAEQEAGVVGKAGRGGKMSNPVEAMEGSVEVVSMIDSQHFVSGGDSGTISLWNLGKKKPIFSVAVAHGFEVTQSETEGEIRNPRWITALAALPFSDLFVSGSWDGCIRVWALTTTSTGGAAQVRGFRHLFDLPAQGVINSLQIITPPLSTVVVSPHDGSLSTLAVSNQEWKRKSGLHSSLSPPSPNQQQQQDEEPQEEGESEEEGDHHTGDGDEVQPKKKLDRVQATKDNCPPIIVAGIGQEHRLGRWIHHKSAKNGALVIPLLLTHPSTTSRSDAATPAARRRRQARIDNDADADADAEAFRLV